MKNRNFFLIPCRMESTRFPNKPLLPIDGLPMFAHVYKRVQLMKHAKSSENVIRVCTPNEEIIDQCVRHNIEVVETSFDHVNGTERIAEAARTLGAADDDIVVNVQGDDPLVIPSDVEELNAYHSSFRHLDMVIPHLRTDDPKNKLAGKIVTDSADKILYISRNAIPSNYRKNMSYKKHLSIYSFRNDALQIFAKEPETELEKSEGIEALRGLELGFNMQTFALKNEYTPVDVPEQYELVKELMKNDELRRLYR